MNMMFPKPTKQKKRKKHKKSIMQQKGDRRCYLCMLLDGDFTYKPYLEEHHVLFGNTHAFAEAEGLKVNLCLEHHRNGPAAVHNNAKNARILMAKAQEVYERIIYRHHRKLIYHEISQSAWLPGAAAGKERHEERAV